MTKRFPTLAVILLAVGILWLLSEMGFIAFKVSWWPVILIIVAVGMILNRYGPECCENDKKRR